MRLGELIAADHVVVGLRVADKEQLLQELARRAGDALALDRRAIFEALHARLCVPSEPVAEQTPGEPSQAMGALR